MRGWLGVVLIGAAACNPYRKVLRSGDFVEVCPGGNPERAWSRFEPGHRFDWAYQAGGPWRAGDDERWELDHETLIVAWNDGYAVTRYDLAKRKGATAPGLSTKDACPSTIHLDWIQKRPDAP